MFVIGLLNTVWQKLQRMARCYRTRKQLAMLDARALKDIGVSRTDALEESRKPFWRC